MSVLVIRMSSLGDVLLSTAFLENLPPETKVDWIISSDFAFVLKNHPRIRKLIVFNKKEGLGGWIRLIHSLSQNQYSARVDLHVTLRSQVARLLFFFLDLVQGKNTPWIRISKERARFLAYLLFKRLVPPSLRPTPIWKRFAKAASPSGSLLPPSYFPVLASRAAQHPNQFEAVLNRYALHPKKYFAFMAASRWRSKEWGARKFAALAETLQKETGFPILLLGRENDRANQELIPLLIARNVHFVSALAEPDFEVTALLLQGALSYSGADTGLAHLAEAVGTKSVVIFGPTRPNLGFGPWRSESRSVFSDVNCSPCSKDGRICYRVLDPYACLRNISVDAVAEAVTEAASETGAQS